MNSHRQQVGPPCRAVPPRVSRNANPLTDVAAAAVDPDDDVIAMAAFGVAALVVGVAVAAGLAGWVIGRRHG